MNISAIGMIYVWDDDEPRGLHAVRLGVYESSQNVDGILIAISSPVVGLFAFYPPTRSQISSSTPSIPRPKLPVTLQQLR